MNRNKFYPWGLIGAWLVGSVSWLFASGCVPQEVPQGEEGGFDWTILIFLALMFALVYFLIIRPQRKRQKEHEELMTELRRGDKVITAGGIYGQIESVSEDSVVLKVESGTTIRVSRGSVTTKRKQ
jgi:preprotein translocase subunit YajC